MIKNNSPKSVDLFLFAGEQSGDNHGAHLLKTLKLQHPNLRNIGVGGPAMRAEGLECIMNMETFQVMGFSDVLLSLPKLWKSFKQIRRTILDCNPSIVILIDYPDFNLRLAKSLRYFGYRGKIVQYVCPTIWAWRAHRIKNMTSTLDLLLTIFPFETKLFSKTSLKAKYVGNPTLNSISNYSYENKWSIKAGIGSPQHLIGIFPGSRKGELKQNLYKQLKAAELLSKDDPNLRFALSIANPALEPIIFSQISRTRLTLNKNLFLVPKKYSYELMRDCRAAIATSGTVTLELGLHRTPTAVVYHVSPFNWAIAKFIFRLSLPNYCIVNITLGLRAFPELVYRQFTAKKLYQQVKELYQETSLRRNCIQKCYKLYNLLDKKNACFASAQEIEALL